MASSCRPDQPADKQVEVDTSSLVVKGDKSGKQAKEAEEQAKQEANQAANQVRFCHQTLNTLGSALDWLGRGLSMEWFCLRKL